LGGNAIEIPFVDQVVAGFEIGKGKGIGIASLRSIDRTFKGHPGGSVALVTEDKVERVVIVGLKAERGSVGEAVFPHQGSPRQVLYITVAPVVDAGYSQKEFISYQRKVYVAVGAELIVVARPHCGSSRSFVGGPVRNELNGTNLCTASIECSLRAFEYLYAIHIEEFDSRTELLTNVDSILKKRNPVVDIHVGVIGGQPPDYQTGEEYRLLLHLKPGCIGRHSAQSLNGILLQKGGGEVRQSNGYISGELRPLLGSNRNLLQLLHSLNGGVGLRMCDVGRCRKSHGLPT